MIGTLAMGGAHAAPGGGPVFSDTFTDTAGTLIAAHTPEVGTWTNGSGNLEIGTGGATLVADSTGYFHFAGFDVGQRDCTIEFDYFHNGTRQYAAFVCAHDTPSAWYTDATKRALEVRIGPTQTIITKWGNSADPAANVLVYGTTYTTILDTVVPVVIGIADTTITVSVNGNEVLNHTLSSGVAAEVAGNTWAGLGAHRGSGTAGSYFDNLVVTPT